MNDLNTIGPDRVTVMVRGSKLIPLGDTFDCAGVPWHAAARHDGYSVTMPRYALPEAVRVLNAPVHTRRLPARAALALLYAAALASVAALVVVMG